MADLLQDFKAFAFLQSSPLDAAFKNDTSKDAELNRTLEVSKNMILRMHGSSVTSLNLPRDGAYAQGLITITKSVANAVIFIPPQTMFFTVTGKMFASLEGATIRQNMQFIPLLVKATTEGEVDNVPANQVWMTTLGGVTVSNPSPITGGVDARVGDPLIVEAVLYLAKYFIQNRQFYHRVREIDVGNLIQEREIQKFEMELGPAVYRHIVGLISHARNAKDFMPSVD